MSNTFLVFCFQAEKTTAFNQMFSRSNRDPRRSGGRDGLILREKPSYHSESLLQQNPNKYIPILSVWAMFFLIRQVL